MLCLFRATSICGDLSCSRTRDVRESYFIIHQTILALIYSDVRSARDASVCVRRSRVTHVYIYFDFHEASERYRQHRSCHAGTIELLRLIAPTSPSRPTRKWNKIECGSVNYRVEIDNIFLFLPNTLSHDERSHSAGTRIVCALR